jgi:hypothetical protein
MKRVFSSFNLAAAHHSKNLLEAAGIRARVRNEMLSSAMGELPPAECQVEVWIERDADLEKAQRVLQRKDLPEGPPWSCASCGESSESQFTQCWRCGASRPA